MVKVYLGSKRIIFYDTGSGFVPPEGSARLVSPGREEAADALGRFIRGGEKGDFYIGGKDIEKIFRIFSGEYIILEAAGGLVTDGAGRYLFIYRRGLWDLPKGKNEAGESIAATALRETTEETGLGELSITRALMPTYHAYEEGGVKILKKTYWFEMKCTGNKKTKPQTEEEITHATWLDREDIKNNVLPATYPNIRELLDDYFMICDL